MSILSRAMVCLAILSTLIPVKAIAQSPTGAISGRVVDLQNQPLERVSIVVESASLQGARRTVSGANGDYLVPLLPPGAYTVRFESTGLPPRTLTAFVELGRTIVLDAALSVVPLQERVAVEGWASPLSVSTGIQQTTTFPQSLMSALPTTRNIDAVLSLSPSVHFTAPFAAPSIAGAMAFESLYLVDGSVVNETIRGQPLGLYIEDAIQETSVITNGISAEYGRLTGGAVNLVTRSGGNTFSGSFRDSLANDRWRGLVPFPGDVRTSNVVSTLEFTVGGPILKDKLWFFGAGRSTGVDQGRTALTVPYTFSDSSRRYEGKLSYAITPGHSLNGTITAIRQESRNIAFSTAIDIRSLYDRQTPQRLISVGYNGVLSRDLALEARVSSRHLAIENEGARTTDLIDGTLLIDRARNRRYWSPTFCGICDSDKRNNSDAFVKLTSFLPTRQFGTHQLVGGYDTFNDIRAYNNHQSGSDYRILGTTSIMEGSAIYPVFVNDGSTLIQYNPIEHDTNGTDFRVHSLFVNDGWRFDRHWTFNLGLRWDKNHGKDAGDQLVSTASAFSPRLGMAWDPDGRGTWTMTASASRYVDALANVVADASAPAGRSTAFQWEYRGPSINVEPGQRVTPDQAIAQVFTWFTEHGGASLPLVSADVPGISTKVSAGLKSPSAMEYAVGLSRAFGARTIVRVDLTRKTFRDAYVTRVDTATGVVRDPFGKSFDLRLIENTNQLDREYRAMTVAVSYRPGSWLDAGGNYTLSRLSGNFEGEDTTTGPIAAATFSYPEYKDAAWSSPNGDLAGDQRHRANVWANYQVHGVRGLGLGIIERISSGVPYGAAGLVDARPFVTNPGYVTPQGANSQRYYYTARDAFRTESLYRTDLALNYAYPLRLASKQVELFGQAQVLNVFNTFAIVNPAAIDTGVLDPVIASSRFPRFDPLTATPVEGVNWARSPTFGRPSAASAYNAARTFQFSFGLRF